MAWLKSPEMHNQKIVREIANKTMNKAKNVKKEDKQQIEQYTAGNISL